MFYLQLGGLVVDLQKIIFLNLISKRGERQERFRVKAS